MPKKLTPFPPFTIPSPEPIIFLKNDWDCPGNGFNVVAFNKYHNGQKVINKANAVKKVNKNHECWICLKATMTGKTVPKNLKECFLCLIKFKLTPNPVPTRNSRSITPKARREPHRNKNGIFIWDWCLEIEEICEATCLYEHFSSKLPYSKYKGNKMRGIFKELTQREAHDVLNFFGQSNLKWRKV